MDRIIKINEEYYIQIDRYNYSVMKNVIQKNGKVAQKAVGHYANMVNALKGYVEHCQRDVTDCTIEQYISEIDRINESCIEEIKRMLPNIK